MIRVLSCCPSGLNSHRDLKSCSAVSTSCGPQSWCSLWVAKAQLVPVTWQCQMLLHPNQNSLSVHYSLIL